MDGKIVDPDPPHNRLTQQELRLLEHPPLPSDETPQVEIVGSSEPSIIQLDYRSRAEIALRRMNSTMSANRYLSAAHYVAQTIPRYPGPTRVETVHQSLCFDRNRARRCLAVCCLGGRPSATPGRLCLFRGVELSLHSVPWASRCVQQHLRPALRRASQLIAGLICTAYSEKRMEGRRATLPGAPA